MAQEPDEKEENKASNAQKEVDGWAYNQGHDPTCASYATADLLTYILENKFDKRMNGDKMARKIAILMNKEGSFPAKVAEKLNVNYNTAPVAFPDCDEVEFWTFKVVCKSILESEVADKDIDGILKEVKKYSEQNQPLYGSILYQENNPKSAHGVVVLRTTDDNKIEVKNSYGHIEPRLIRDPSNFRYFVEMNINSLKKCAKPKPTYNAAGSQDRDARTIVIDLGYRTKAEAANISDGNCRNTLIVELAMISDDGIKDCQGYQNNEIIGKLYIVNLLRDWNIKAVTNLQVTTTDDQRTLMIAEIISKLEMSKDELQEKSDYDLASIFETNNAKWPW
eukprot:231217_1